MLGGKESNLAKKRKRTRTRQAFCLLCFSRNSFILMQTNYTWIVVFKITDIKFSGSDFQPCPTFCVHTSKGPHRNSPKAPRLIEPVSFQGGFVTFGARKGRLSHLLHKACLRVEAPPVPHCPQFSPVSLSLPDIRLLEYKHCTAVSIVGASSARRPQLKAVL